MAEPTMPAMTTGSSGDASGQPSTRASRDAPKRPLQAIAPSPSARSATSVPSAATSVARRWVDPQSMPMKAAVIAMVTCEPGMPGPHPLERSEPDLDLGAVGHGVGLVGRETVVVGGGLRGGLVVVGVGHVQAQLRALPEVRAGRQGRADGDLGHVL